MGRSKEIAKKSKHDVGESSRSRTRQQATAPQEPGSRSLRHLTPIQLATVDNYKGKQLSVGRHFEDNVLREFGCLQEVNMLLRHPQLRYLFQWRGPTYAPVTYEFLATLEIRREVNDARESISFTLFGNHYSMSVNTLGVTLGFHDATSVSMPYFRDFKEDFDSDEVARRYWRSITNNAPYNSSNLKAKLITRNALKAIRLAFAINLSGRTTNRNKVYKQDLFYMWCMENDVSINMGVQARKWLQTQLKPKVQTVFIGPFVSKLCIGLGLLDRLMGERSDGCSISFTVGEFFAAELRLGGDDAPDLNASDNDDEDEEENEEEDAAQEQGPTPMEWTASQNFHRQLHEEQMNYWREEHTWQEGHFTSISARQDVHTEDLNRMRQAVENNDRRIAALEARFDRQFHPFGDE